MHLNVCRTGCNFSCPDNKFGRTGSCWVLRRQITPFGPISPCAWVTNVMNYYYLEEFEIYCWNVLRVTCSCYWQYWVQAHSGDPCQIIAFYLSSQIDLIFVSLPICLITLMFFTVSACFQNILKDGILRYFRHSGHGVPAPQGIQMKVVIIF